MLGNHLAEIPLEAWKTEGQIHSQGELLFLDPAECLFFLILPPRGMKKQQHKSQWLGQRPLRISLSPLEAQN